jgi:hypothetical protein
MKSSVWIRKKFFRIWIRGSVILNCGSGSGSPINYGSDWLDPFPDHTVPGHIDIIKYCNFF